MTDKSVNFRFLISDEVNDIDDFASLNVTISKIGVHQGGESGNWTEFDLGDPGESVNLTELKDTNATEIWSGELKNGTYNKVFIYITAIDWELKEGNGTSEVKLPGGKLQISKPFEVKDGIVTNFVYDVTVIEAGKSGKYILKPQIAQSGADQKFNEITPSKAGADLEINKTENLDPILTGENLTYTITIYNNGPHDATSVNVTDTLPPEVTYQSANTSIGSYSESGGIVTWLINNMDRSFW
jgi:uncharacterized repeat protein (TIGR01451 family)